MKHVKFKPWVGQSYRSGFNGLRTLILGESHYRPPVADEFENNPNFTIECIQEQVDGDLTRAFWTNIAAALVGSSDLDLETKRAFWGQVAFANYVQEFVGDSARVPPSPESWGRSELAFKELLDELKPQFILGLGYRLWDNSPNFDGYVGPSVEGAPHEKTWVYNHKGGSGLFYCIRHPSSGFSSVDWHAHIQKAMDLARS